MSKNILHDIMPGERRSIRNVTMSADRGAPPESNEIYYEREELLPDAGNGRRMHTGKIVLWALAFCFVIALGFAFFSNFNKATVTVTPKVAYAAGLHEYVASKDASRGLSFSAVPIVRTGEAVVTATETKHQEERASGAIMVYNNFTDKPQRLIKNTRFETPTGLIYRIDHSIVIPGRAVSGGKTVPGSVEATVFADSPGADYNIDLTDFTIPGFKSDRSRFAGFYARSKTPISGGFVGDVNMPSETDAAAARASLRAQLEKEVRDLAKRSVPDNGILFDDAISLSFESLPIESRGSDKAAIKEKATAVAFLFDKAALSKAIAAESVKSYDGSPVEIPNLDALSFSFSEVPQGDAAAAPTLRFTLSGNAQIVWQFEPAKLKTALLGKQKNDLAAALSSFPTIEKIDVVIRPFWNRSFPDNPDKVSVERSLPKEDAAPENASPGR